VRHGLLAGREHQRLGDLAVISEGRAAIALSKGGAPKRYAHVDPNEDAALFAIGECGMLVAVADGHNGATAAEQAVQYVVAEVAEQWTMRACAITTHADWERAGAALLEGINEAILETARVQSLPAAHSTFSLALVRPDEDLLLSVGIGDSHIFRAHADEATDCGWSGRIAEDGAKLRAYYLGYELPKTRALSSMSAVQCAPLGDIDAIVLATDGLSEVGIGVADPAAAVVAATRAATREKADLRPLHACRAVATTALEAQRENLAGDNIATAVLWLADTE
jgi:serine/threonine protein phosphatase PrpC